MKKLKFAVLIIFLSLLFHYSCQRSPYPGYEKTDTGLYYKIIRGNSDKPLPVEGDVLTIEMNYYLHDNDSLLFTTKNSSTPVTLPVTKGLFKGDINEGLFMITEGDSASFIVKADSFLIYNVGLTQMPPYITPQSMFRFEMKVLSHKTREEFQVEQRLRQEQHLAKMEELKKQEVIDREAWLSENKIKVKPTASGMYFIKEKSGTGAKIEPGDLVKAHYTGYLLNGQIFDSSVNAPEPFSFVAGKGEVIQGWDEAVLMMRVGDKARIILPSDLAYGESNPKIPIPPYATLIFDIEIVGIEKNTNLKKK